MSGAREAPHGLLACTTRASFPTDYVENNMLQDAFDMGWSGLDWRAPRPSHRLPPAEAAAKAQLNTEAKGELSGLDRVHEEDEPPPSSPEPSRLIRNELAIIGAPAPPAADPPPSGYPASTGSEEGFEDEDEEEQRRLEWIKYYVKIGKMQEVSAPTTRGPHRQRTHGETPRLVRNARIVARCHSCRSIRKATQALARGTSHERSCHMQQSRTCALCA